MRRFTKAIAAARTTLLDVAGLSLLVAAVVVGLGVAAGLAAGGVALLVLSWRSE